MQNLRSFFGSTVKAQPASVKTRGNCVIKFVGPTSQKFQPATSVATGRRTVERVPQLISLPC